MGELQTEVKQLHQLQLSTSLSSSSFTALLLLTSAAGFTCSFSSSSSVFTGRYEELEVDTDGAKGDFAADWGASASGDLTADSGADDKDLISDRVINNHQRNYAYNR